MSIFNYIFFLKLSIFSDISEPWQLGFQDPATPIMEGIINFHNDLMVYIVFIVTFVCWILFRTIFFFFNNHLTKKFVHGTLIEIIWTLIPAIILILIAFPSFALLYSMDEILDPVMTLKVIGHQWFWEYEYSDIQIEDKETISFESYLIQESDLNFGHFRLLEVDNRVVLPINTHIRILVSASDVLHCWAIPSLGIKIDACPGRLNQISLFIKREGVFYGQCSEICGINHGFMPIVIEAVNLTDYITWLTTKE